MKKIIALALIAMISMSATTPKKSFHSYTVKDIDGKEFALSQLKGKKVLVVNVASKCGLTPQYEKLQELYEKYKDKDFTIVGFPANNFLGQEPGTNEEIKTFCTSKYDVKFHMMSKVSVKGDDQCEVYQWLTQKKLNNKMDSKVKWNFQKYMIDEKGQLVDVVYPRESPMSEKITNWIEQ